MHFGLSAEVSDQNFEDEDQGEMSSRASMVKRLKTASVDATNNDQVMILKKNVPAIWLITYIFKIMCLLQTCYYLESDFCPLLNVLFQVVPLGKFRMTDVSTVNNASSEREQEGTYELLSEHPESFVCPKSDQHYCLKGS